MNYCTFSIKNANLLSMSANKRTTSFKSPVFVIAVFPIIVSAATVFFFLAVIGRSSPSGSAAAAIAVLLLIVSSIASRPVNSMISSIGLCSLIPPPIYALRHKWNL